MINASRRGKVFLHRRQLKVFFRLESSLCLCPHTPHFTAAEPTRSQAKVSEPSRATTIPAIAAYWAMVGDISGLPAIPSHPPRGRALRGERIHRSGHVTRRPQMYRGLGYRRVDSVSPSHGGPHRPRPAALASCSAAAISAYFWTGLLS